MKDVRKLNTNNESKGRIIAYWAITAIILTETAVGAYWDIARIPFVRNIMTELGYPLYFLVILGVWKVLAVIALLAPRFPRVKEWAYAGLFLTYSGAAISHLAMGDSSKAWGPLVFVALTIISWALRPASRKLLKGYAIEPDKEATGRKQLIAYWTATGIIEFVVLSGGMADMFQRGGTVEGMVQLGYPLYFITLLGCWKVLGGIALLLPRFQLLKEWAYAGIVFNMTGAVASHIVNGDSVTHFIAPLSFAIIAMVSWALRPASRRIGADGYIVQFGQRSLQPA
ncbi:MAG TPA: DoxX family protein [Chitinophaga sp.]|uniref:DoxX family protein n=1 Tax=Chitinophaga sp. TaxID=1869181 RepID=UPI002C6BC922|nr:DoxX family protein [Chitinophaga sp.]HVI44196.1 DoxX family protein [Chitinophaga sp.]